MSWQEFGLYEIGEGVPWVKIGAAGRTKSAYPQLVVQLSKSVACYLGLTAGERLAIDRGILGDDGWLMLRRSPTGVKVQQHGHAGCMRTRCTGRRLGVNRKHTPEVVKHKLVVTERGGCPAVVVKLPSWARGGEDV